MLNRLRPLFPSNTRQYREETAQRIAWGHWFALLNIVLAILIATRYAFNVDYPNTLFGKLYFLTSLFGHFSFVVFAFYLLLLFPLSFILKNDRGFRGVAVILATFGQTLLLLDTEVFKQFYLHLSPLVWDLLVTPDNGELARQWQLLFVPMPLILLAEMLYSRWCWQKLRSFNRQKWGKYVAVFFLSCFTATHLIYAWADLALYRPVTTQRANYPLSYPLTARVFLEKHGLVSRAEILQNEEETGRADTFYLHYPKNPLQATKTSQTNILLLNLSGLTNEMIVAENMPNLTAISQQSHRFMNHYASGNSPTASKLGLFYGLSGKYLDSVLNEKAPSPMLEMLAEQGYQFGLFTHQNEDDTLFHRATFAKVNAKVEKGTWQKADSNLAMINGWKAWLANRQTPFFSYLELAMPTANDEAQQAKLLDWQFNTIWQTLSEQGLLANTLVMITSDLTKEDSKQADKNGNYFAKSHLHVPMMFYWQGEGQIYHQLSSHLDIMPTVLTQFFGVKNPVDDYAQGIDLTTKNDRLWVLASDYRWNVAIMPDGEQYQVDRKGHFENFSPQGQKENSSRPPLALFLQMIKQSNEFINK